MKPWLRNTEVEHPTRGRWLVRTVLDRIGVRYREACPVYDPDRQKGKGDWRSNGRRYRADFVIQLPNKKLMVLLFHPYSGHGIKREDMERFESKKNFLSRKRLVIVLKRTLTSQEYELEIRLAMRQHPKTRKEL